MSFIECYVWRQVKSATTSENLLESIIWGVTVATKRFKNSVLLCLWMQVNK